MFVDSHCHLDFPELRSDLDGVLARMRENGITHALTISTTLETFPAVRDVARSQPNLWCSAGVHPDERGDGREASVEELLAMADDPKVVAIGETGLDYFRVEGDLDWQRERFRRHIRAARACAKPLVIHTRQSAADTVRILDEEGARDVGGVMHCFTETWDVAKAAIDLGFYISFSGIVTFKNARDLKEVAKQVPLDRMLVETDSPYLAPVPHRGKTNEPSFVRHVAEEVARLKEVPLEAVAEATTKNFFALFRNARPAAA
ncbi:putative metal-dependent hydrolase YcfH [Usitatibacter rugosus]|uniref:Putative metal-dependent hydrolase YcfH n=1 Tax=Usitatibacter rugosus TaxID=2732067 RepID=A0A6M4GVC1_9PROT|nr:TatD family hydrolase [Usitatibacter rugosus]QJR11116.1 putative metal-dependent hydrolase YcfH [Usitatibacter rugosus]